MSGLAGSVLNGIAKLSTDTHVSTMDLPEDRLLPMVYEELRRMAAVKMRRA